MAQPTEEAQNFGGWPVNGGAPPADGVAWVVGVGAKQGTGAAVARRFAAGGLHVVVTGRTKEKIAEVVEDIRSRGGRATAVVGDAGTEAGLQESLATVDELGPLVVATYNAGGSQWRSSMLDMDAEFFESVWRTNCFGAFLTGRESARRMVGRGGGAILFTGSVSGVIARPKLAAYASAKFGQRAVAQALAREFGPRNIHVANIIVHGPIDGDRLNSAFPQAKDRRPKDGMLDIEQIAETFWQVLVQPRTAWTQEMDIRPYCEEF
ncbi:SDR family NAD(P)-dependent oxidoreductase [Nonomuraea wenchangensis]|uniref:NADP-dependent 3-hydroxy acid dehydrogenase YdfG n=1 Tax=Nonomuraea wenchangensis TaxID=568860 RepID=A0A1I0LBN1_9ACTN|nr:SDR family NAD(P)-dependent oxidoreductase [Nonomuraea wenchangensis]SEU37464.1 NADP-dependent 3-hydroxy acid dehydrogenase YdfG [Nonomuraea wenchangensis]